MTNERGIPDAKAREILGRAAEIDRTASEVVSIETLRAAAHEAGIAPSSFEAALEEHSQQAVAGPRSAARPRRRLWLGALAGVGAAVLLLLVLTFVSRIVP
jgi:hypothetical protein